MRKLVASFILVCIIGYTYYVNTPEYKAHKYCYMISTEPAACEANQLEHVKAYRQGRYP